MERWTSLCAYMPMPIREMLERASSAFAECAQEIRLRRGGALTLSTAQGCFTFPLTVTSQQIQECFWRLCGQAVHTHQAELAQGFVTTADGFRVGVAGTAVVKDGYVVSYRDITSLCIRLSRTIEGAARHLLPFVDREDGVKSMLLCGAPACGKTTVLRDLAKSLSASRRVCVVDERSELVLGGLTECDVLRACPKAQGILQAVRTLAPDVIVVDELGDEQEWRAVMQSCYCGVSIVASAHIASVNEVMARPSVVDSLRHGGFEWLAILPPRHRVDEATMLWKGEDFLEDAGHSFCRVCLRGNGDLGEHEAQAARARMDGVGAIASAPSWVAPIYRVADSRAVGTYG